MIRPILFASLLMLGVSAFAVPGAYAQTTDQTDASEEDWRRSQRKARSADDFDPILNPNTVGTGAPLPEYRPIDTLPEESRRHLQRQRAKIIAEVEFGEDPGEVPFEPSEAAKSDPNLAADEEEAWEVILTDLRGSGSADSQGEGGPNKVAVAGRGGSPSGSVTRGGSAQSAADILAQLKGLQQAGIRPGGSGSGGAPSGDQGGGLGTSPQQGQGTAQSQADGQGASQQQGQQAGGQGQANGQGQASGQDGQTGQDGASGTGSSDGADGSGGQAGGDGGASGDQGAAGASSAASDVQPFQLPDNTQRPEDTRGSTSSASDFLKSVTGGQTEEEDSDEE